jgi:hypothetical protein
VPNAGALARVTRDDAAVLAALDHAVVTGIGVGTAAAAAVDLAFGWSLIGRAAVGRDRVARLVAVLDPSSPRPGVGARVPDRLRGRRRGRV